MTWASKLILTLANFFPISFIIGLMCFKACASNPGWTFLLLAAAGLASSIFVASQLTGKIAGSHIALKNIEESNEDLIVYITSFMPPFIADDITNPFVAGSLATFYALLLVTIVSSKKVFANPIYLLMGIRFYSAETDPKTGSGTRVFLIARKQNLSGSLTLKLKKMGHDKCYLVTE